MRLSNGDRGAAIVLVLWGLVVGGALLTVVTVLSVQEQRAAGALRQEERSLVGAERTGAELMAHLSLGLLRRGLAQAFDSLSLDAGTGWSAQVRRLSADRFLLEVSPQAARSGVRLGWILRPAPESLVPNAVVSLQRAASLGEDVVINGADEVPPGLDDCPPAAPAESGLAGVAVVSRDSSGVMGAFTRWSDRATLVLPGGAFSPGPATVGTACDLRPETNWGDPLAPSSPCSGYVPVISVRGDVTIVGGSGQGILLVNGNLHVTSAFVFYGIVLVTGDVDIEGPTDIRGLLAAAGLRSGTSQVTQLKVRYSKCIISKDLEISSSLKPLGSRAWKQLFQAP